MTEDDLLKQVLKLAEKYNVTAFHTYDSRKSTGHGFPDLVMVGHQNVLFVELKSQGANRSTRQTDWFYRLTGAGAHYSLWRPTDYVSGHIESVLRDL